MNKEILNIVVTGGPCGGKTTALDELTKLLRSYGYMVYLVNETATELINDGIRPFGDNKLTGRCFQELIIDAQLAKENIRKRAALYNDTSKVAILYDRGILDGRAYIDEESFCQMLQDRGMQESDILRRYDLVIHMVTAAIGKEEYYTTLNNSARTETVEQARYQDRKTVEAWRNHPNLKIVNNDTMFDGKIMKVKNFIRAYIGEEEVLRQERYLLDVSDIDLTKFNHSMIKEEIEEFVLSYDTDQIELYSKSTINGSSYYTCTRKEAGINYKKCRMISEELYDNYRNKVKGNTLKKVRYNFIDNSERFRLDIIDVDTKKFAILERDVIGNSKELPAFTINAVEITDNRDYDDDSIYIDYNINKIYSKNMKKK